MPELLAAADEDRSSVEQVSRCEVGVAAGLLTIHGDSAAGKELASLALGGGERSLGEQLEQRHAAAFQQSARMRRMRDVGKDLLESRLVESTDVAGEERRAGGFHALELGLAVNQLRHAASQLAVSLPLFRCGVMLSLNGGDLRLRQHREPLQKLHDVLIVDVDPVLV